MPTIPKAKSAPLVTRSIMEIDGQVIVDSANTQIYTVDWNNVSLLVHNPKWRSQVRNHLSATTPYSASKQEVIMTPGSCNIVVDHMIPGIEWVDSFLARGWFIQNIAPPSFGGDVSSADTAYVTFIRKAQKELRSIQGLVALGELPELIHAVRHPLESLKKGFASYLDAVPKRARKAARYSLPRDINRDLNARGILSLRQGRRSRPPKRSTRSEAISSAITGTYLEYANGWKPAISDIVSASKALAEYHTPSGVGYRKVTATAEDPVYVQVLPEQVSSVGGPFAWYQRQIYRSQSSTKMVGEVVVSSTGTGADFRRNAGFTLAGFVPSLWELLPLSYVADYFLNMGNVLEAMAFNQAVVQWWSRTTRVQSSNTYFGAIIPPLPGITFRRYNGDPGKVVWSHTSVLRDNPNGYMPSLAFTLPGSHLLSKLANVSSLLVQANNSSKQISRFLNG